MYQCRKLVARASRTFWHTSTSGRNSRRSVLFPNCPSHSSGLNLDQAYNKPDTLQHKQIRTIRSHTLERRSWIKPLNKSPGEILALALQDAGFGHHVPAAPKGKVDLSYLPSESPAANERTRLSIPTILAEYVQTKHSSAKLHTATKPANRRREGLKVQEGSLLSKDALDYLSALGYGEGNVTEWYDILTTPDGEHGARQIASYIRPTDDATSEVKTGQPNLPYSVFLFFLRRGNFSPKAIHDLLNYAWHLVHRDTSSRHSRALKLDEISVMIPRLLRVVRKNWPEAFPTVGLIFTEYLDHLDSWLQTIKSSTITNAVRQHMNIFCNRVLNLLALPSPVRPYNSVNMLERAQFDIIRKMTECRPPLTVNREGYRAVVRVQLANKKTPQEQDWAGLKMKSWPPWKEDKTGLDQDKDFFYGLSRARKAIEHQIIAGYGMRNWEQIASVSSGWNTDGSPTIQTRKWFLGRNINMPKRPNKSLIWVSRIEATRNINEAWSYFLACEDSGMSPTQPIYQAMMEKVDAEAVRLRNKAKFLATQQPFANRLEAFGGDGKEVSETPISPKEKMIVRTSPPNHMDELAETMYGRGIRPSGNCLNFLVSRATSISKGMKYLRWGQEIEPSLEILFSSSANDRHLSLVPMKTFNAFLELLCKFYDNKLPLTYRHLTSSYSSNMGGNSMRDDMSLTYAIQLLLARKPSNMSAYHAVFRGIVSCDINSVFREGKYHRGSEAFRFMVMRKMVDTIKTSHMKCDVKLLQRLLQAAMSAVVANRHFEHGSSNDTSTKICVKPSEQASVKRPPSTGDIVDFIRTMFLEVYGESLLDASNDNFRLPQLLAFPEPSLLHSYVRLLGSARDFKSLLELVKWITLHKKEIEGGAEMPRNGWVSLRKTVVAVKVACETHMLSHPVDKKRDRNVDDIESAPREITSEIMRLMNGLEDWGGAPSNEDVESYVRFGNLARKFTM